MTWLSAALVALAAAPVGRAGDVVGPMAIPASAEASFSAEAALWGLERLDGVDPAASLASLLDDSVVLFVSRRARFDGADVGVVYLAGGLELITDGLLTDERIEAHLGTGACLAVLTCEAPPAAESLHVAAGVYRPAGAPRIEGSPAGTRIVLEFALEGQPVGASLLSLECLLPDDAGLDALAVTLPSFMTLARKAEPAFDDPPMDARPIGSSDTGLRARRRQILALADGLAEIAAQEGPYGFRIPDRLDAPELVGTARPSFFGLFSSRPVDPNPYDPTSDWDFHQRRLDRQHGISN